MINPQLEIILNTLKLKKVKDFEEIEQLFLQLEGEQPEALIYTRKINENTDSFNNIIEVIDFDKLCKICTFLTDLNFSIGTDFMSLYCNHRHVKQLRVTIPQNHISLIYDDGSADIDFSIIVAEKMRSLLKIYE